LGRRDNVPAAHGVIERSVHDIRYDWRCGSGSQRRLITVGDSGPGVDPENLERFFEPLYTTKSHGMAMGLSICRSIVEAHGGRVSASLGTHADWLCG
jgi:signal transduction histidine kinase